MRCACEEQALLHYLAVVESCKEQGAVVKEACVKQAIVESDIEGRAVCGGHYLCGQTVREMCVK